MQLSEAIATGRVLGRTLTADIFLSDCHACALGTAALALGYKSYSWRAMNEKWPWLGQELKFYCPLCEKDLVEQGDDAVSHMMGHVAGLEPVEHLAPCYKSLKKALTFDQLIDWVRSVEPPAAPPVSGEQEREKESCGAKQ